MESLIEIDRLTGSIYLLRDLIQERLGLSFNYDTGITVITNRLADRLKQTDCKSFLEYYFLLMSGDPTAEAEWQYLMAALAKSVSSFFRHTDLLRILVDVALPQLFSISRPEPLRIWSACCAGGEEPILIAMALKGGGLV